MYPGRPHSPLPWLLASLGHPCGQNSLDCKQTSPSQMRLQPLAVREQSVVLPTSVESLILAPSDPQIANGVRKRKRLTQAERLAQPSHSDVQAQSASSVCSSS
eukprot:6189090-Pleurochrysis_carterae.AAC.1